jgi:hypothetical protein
LCRQSEKRLLGNTNAHRQIEKRVPGNMNVCRQMGLSLNILVDYLLKASQMKSKKRKKIAV